MARLASSDTGCFPPSAHALYRYPGSILLANSTHLPPKKKTPVVIKQNVGVPKTKQFRKGSPSVACGLFQKPLAHWSPSRPPAGRLPIQSIPSLMLGLPGHRQ